MCQVRIDQNSGFLLFWMPICTFVDFIFVGHTRFDRNSDVNGLGRNTAHCYRRCPAISSSRNSLVSPFLPNCSCFNRSSHFCYKSGYPNNCSRCLDLYTDVDCKKNCNLFWIFSTVGRLKISQEIQLQVALRLRPCGARSPPASRDQARPRSMEKKQWLPPFDDEGLTEEQKELVHPQCEPCPPDTNRMDHISPCGPTDQSNRRRCAAHMAIFHPPKCLSPFSGFPEADQADAIMNMFSNDMCRRSPFPRRQNPMVKVCGAQAPSPGQPCEGFAPCLVDAPEIICPIDPCPRMGIDSWCAYQESAKRSPTADKKAPTPPCKLPSPPTVSPKNSRMEREYERICKRRSPPGSLSEEVCSSPERPCRYPDTTLKEIPGAGDLSPCTRSDHGNNSHQKLKLRPLLTHLAQKEDPWNRVNRTHTLCSTRHEVCYTDPKAPRDALDFALTSVYRPHYDWDQPRADAVMQKETLCMDHGRILKNRVVFVPERKPVLGHPLRINYWHICEHPSYVKKAIRGVHTQLTNPGYSRKAEDGNVYL